MLDSLTLIRWYFRVLSLVLSLSFLPLSYLMVGILGCGSYQHTNVNLLPNQLVGITAKRAAVNPTSGNADVNLYFNPKYLIRLSETKPKSNHFGYTFELGKFSVHENFRGIIRI